MNLSNNGDVVSEHSSDFGSDIIRNISDTPNSNNKRYAYIASSNNRRKRLKRNPASHQDDVSSVTSNASISTISNAASRSLNTQNHTNIHSQFTSLTNLPLPNIPSPSTSMNGAPSTLASQLISM